MSSNSVPQGQVSTTWRPDQGEHPRTIVGKLLDVRTVEGAYGPYPLVELEQDDGAGWSIHAFRDVLKSELAACAPQVGDLISVAYGGRSDKGYYLYRVRRADGKPRRVDWSQFGGTAVDGQPVESDVPIDASDLDAVPVGEATVSVAERAEQGDDDIPF